MASGIFIVPILTVLGVDVHIAIGTSIISVIACSCGSAASFLKQRLTNVRLAVVLETATTLGAASGVLLSGAISVPVLYAIFAAVLLVSAWQMLMRRGAARDAPYGKRVDGWVRRLDSVYPDRAVGDVAYRVERLPAGLALMYGAGLLSALLGIGSGVLKIPAMDSALRLPIKVSSATSNFMIGVTAAASAGIYYARGDILANVAAPVALGSIFGAYLGAKILMRTSNERIRALFIVVLLALAVKMFMTALEGRHPAGGI
jgi:uncharacterized protein